VRFLRRPRVHTSWEHRLYVRLVALALLVAYTVAFILENGKTVSVHFVFGTASVSLVWVILLSLGVGLLAGILVVQLERRRRRRSREAPERGDPV
jgi:uncharacterized integral membrane protein